MDDLLSEFLTETSENLATLDLELVNLEQNPNDKGILSNVFRLVHTIKGTCGFLGLPRLETLAHAGENVLGKFRDGALRVTPDSVTLILASIDRIKLILAHLEATEKEPEGDDKDLIAALNATAEGRAASAPEAPASGGPVVADGGFPVAAELLAEVEQALAAGKAAASEEEIAMAMAMEREAVERARPSVPVPAAPPPGPTAPESGGAIATMDDGSRKDSVAAHSIRVNVDVLENLMTLVSELVLTRNQLLQMVRGRDDSEFTAPLQRLSHITTDLQEGVMKTRMQPIGNAWAKLPRIIRDLSIEVGKKIDLQMVGAETELDRQVLELIKDPLTHMVRNSADHGIEPPAERVAAGKSETGVVRLNAYHQGGHIIVEISDDGRGLSIDRIRRKAIMNGLASEAELDGMSEQQIAQFIFRAGFSTAEQVTSVSGRGVGMDVVRTNIERIGGTIELTTRQGAGTTFTIKIPLTLAIVSALIVEAGGQRFAMPQISVTELVRVAPSSEHRIEMLDRAPVLRLRDRLLPLVSLPELLRLQSPEEAAERINSEVFVIVAQVGASSFGVIVDKVFDTEEIVVKPVPPILRDITMFSGNTILGDGSVIMILDPNGIAGAAAERAREAASETLGEDSSRRAGEGERKTTLLVFRAGETDSKAVPLALVARLEEIPAGSIEQSSGRPVVQYRGQLMPLVLVNGLASLRREGGQPVLVFADGERRMGLAVSEIVDIVEDVLHVDLSARAEGLLGTAVVQGRATEVIDTGYYLTQAFDDWFAPARRETARRRRVLVVDDSAFFRTLVAPVLIAAGLDVKACEGAREALALRDRNERFDAIVTDIDMPGMDGFQFAEAVRAEGPWREIPLIALSAHHGTAELEKGHRVGFDDYVAKFDRDTLLKALDGLLERSA